MALLSGLNVGFFMLSGWLTLKHLDKIKRQRDEDSWDGWLFHAED